MRKKVLRPVICHINSASAVVAQLYCGSDTVSGARLCGPRKSKGGIRGYYRPGLLGQRDPSIIVVRTTRGLPPTWAVQGESEDTKM